MDKLKTRKEIGFSKETKIVIFVGGFKKWHGIDKIIHAVPLVTKKCDDVLFVLVGSSKNQELDQELKRKIKDLKIEKNVLLTGTIPYTEVPKYINASDVSVCYVSGHRRNEKITFTALKMMEYMACGKAMIVTTPCAVDIKIKENDAGEVIEPDNVEKLAEKILILLNNKELNSKYGKNALELLRAHYTWDAAAKKTEEAVFDLIERKYTKP
jgi:glycosyltransferase involved in cell wall biosynthesis